MAKFDFFLLFIWEKAHTQDLNACQSQKMHKILYHRIWSCDLIEFKFFDQPGFYLIL
jgi:hypothetical protein